MEKKPSLVKSQELDYSRKQIADLRGKLKFTSFLLSGLLHQEIYHIYVMCIEYYVYSLDEEMMELYYEKTLEREPLEEKKSKPAKVKSDISDKMLEKG